MNILRVIASVDPATGGPVAGMRAITPVLSTLGITTEFLTVDDPFASYLQSWVGQTHALGPAKSSYAYTKKIAPWLEKNVQRYDAVIMHGLWQYLGLAVRKACLKRGVPYFVFPHGMMDPGLRRTYPVKHIKKWLYWQVAERRVLRDARAVFYTCEEERRLARTTFPFYKCHDRVVGYGTNTPEGRPEIWQSAWADRCPTVAGHRYFLFLGRIHSKKGVDILIRAYAAITRAYATSHGGTPPDLVIAGPCFDDAFITGLKQQAEAEGVAKSIHWPGMLNGPAKWGALQGCEAFVLPSHQENFGIAVVEALACGRPVLISDRVNIWNELSSDQAALVESDSAAGTVRLFQRWLTLTAEQRGAMAQAARASFERRFEISRAAENFSSQLTSLTARAAATLS